MLRRLLVIASILMISGVFPVASVSGLPVFFVGMQAKYEFILEVTSDGQIACRTSSIRNWTILEVGKNVAKADVQVELLYLNGSVPEPVKDWYDPSQNASVREILTFHLNESGWGFYLNNTATDLMRYEVGKESFESKVGEVGCYHLQVRNPNQRWDAFHDLATGILIHLEETFSVNGYTVTYSLNILGTNANLSPPISGFSNYTIFLIVAAPVMIAAIVSIGFWKLRKRRASREW